MPRENCYRNKFIAYPTLLFGQLCLRLHRHLPETSWGLHSHRHFRDSKMSKSFFSSVYIPLVSCDLEMDDKASLVMNEAAVDRVDTPPPPLTSDNTPITSPVVAERRFSYPFKVPSILSPVPGGLKIKYWRLHPDIPRLEESKFNGNAAGFDLFSTETIVVPPTGNTPLVLFRGSSHSFRNSADPYWFDNAATGWLLWKNRNEKWFGLQSSARCPRRCYRYV